MKRKIITSATVALLSSLYGGAIITDADQGFTPNKQYAYGGWNMENVEVKIVDILDPHYNIGTFNESDGSYSDMSYGMSFESDISNPEVGVVGRLHGKDWPIGEPSGIKVINGDTNVKNGKPENCLMTTSYLSDGYLDSSDPKPNTCSGPFKSHKRFKVDMTKDIYIADDAFGHSFDLTFNLEPGDHSIKRYQVFQKINNHTGKRLNGYKLEVLDGNKEKNRYLTLSLGYDEYVGEEEGREDIWTVDELANISHGLWGIVDDHFPNGGFFDNESVYYPVTLSDGNRTISYVGPMQGGNYQSIFGNWLPSKWHPYGIYFDDDNDTYTDPILLAFWGDPLKTGKNEWHKGIDDNWSTLTEEEIALWTQAGGAYEIIGIDDSVNLGLNYIINIGDNALIGDTITIRITPHFAPTSQQVAPSYVDDEPLPNHPGSERDDPEDGRGSLSAYSYLSLLVILFGFIGINLFGREK